MSKQEPLHFYPESPSHWREWLAENHVQYESVWVIFYKKSTGKPTLSWSEAVDEALCFGWIDSVKRTLDEERSIQFFSKRKAKSTWSKINKDKIEKLNAAGKMEQAGWAIIELAKVNRSWNLLDEVEELIIPEDLALQFEQKPAAHSYYSALTKSHKKMLLQWLVLAKRPETRQKRIDEIISSAEANVKPSILPK